jgi:hypothetical protein
MTKLLRDLGVKTPRMTDFKEASRILSEHGKEPSAALAKRSTTSATPPSMTVPTVSDSLRRAGTDPLKPVEDTGEPGRRWGVMAGAGRKMGGRGLKKTLHGGQKKVLLRLHEGSCKWLFISK